MPQQLSGEPLWAVGGMYVATFPDVVVTRTSDGAGEVLTATSADGSMVWAKSLTGPESFRDAALKVSRVRDQIVVSWTDVEPALTVNEDVNPGQLTLLDPATGEQQGETIEIPDAFAFQGVRNYDTFEMLKNEGEEQTYTLLSDGSVERVPESGKASLPEGEFVTDVTTDRQLREFSGETGTRSVEVIDTTSSQPLAPATECPSRIVGLGDGELSPSSTYIGIGQGVINIETGKVTCMDALSEPPNASAQVVGDDGAAFGTGTGTADQSLTFYLDPAGEVSVEEGRLTLPAALLPGIAIFTAEDGEIVTTTAFGDLVVAYER